MAKVNLTLPALKFVLFVLKCLSDYITAKVRGFKLILFRALIY